MTKCFVSGPNRKIRCLQPEAIPSIFPGVPSYLSITIPKPRSEKSTRDARAKQEFQRSEEAAKSFLDEDIIVNLEQLNTSSNFPPSWKITSVKNDDNIILEEIIFDEEQKPNFGYSLTVFQTLKFRLVKSNCILPNSRVQHICKNSKIERVSDVQNILAFLRNLDDVKKEDQVYRCLQQLDRILEEEDEDSPRAKKLAFIRSQLALVYSQQPRYSSSFIWTSLTWMKTAPALYKMLLQDGQLSLPSLSYLKRVSSAFSLESGLSTDVIAYLQTRFNNLDSTQKVVSLLIDEVKTLTKLLKLDLVMVLTVL